MNPLTIHRLQEYLALKYSGRASATGMFMKLVEEVGEAAEALNKMEGRKADDHAASLEKELADIIHYTVAIAVVHGINLSKAIIEKDKTASVKYNQSPNLEEYLKKG